MLAAVVGYMLRVRVRAPAHLGRPRPQSDAAVVATRRAAVADVVHQLDVDGQPCCIVLLQQRVAYHEVLGALLAAAVAGVITHVPAGLGVLEAVFVALLVGQVPKEQLLAVLLIYRALYYLAPLIVATLMYVLLEARLKKARRGDAAPRRPAAGDAMQVLSSPARQVLHEPGGIRAAHAEGVSREPGAAARRRCRVLRAAVDRAVADPRP